MHSFAKLLPAAIQALFLCTTLLLPACTMDVSKTPAPAHARQSGMSNSVVVSGNAMTAPFTGMEFVWVPGGCFLMGESAQTADGQGSSREVCVNGFWMGKYEVTQKQWRLVMESDAVSLPAPPAMPPGADVLLVDPKNPSMLKGDDLPVERVSWNLAQDFAKGLSKLSKATFRLPTEAEWEYACRSGGLPQQYCGGDAPEPLAWYKENSGRRPHEVGGKAPNGLGLYDMSGNVWEWCEDIYETASDNADNAPRVTRGGGFNTDTAGLRSTFRGRVSPAVMAMEMGLRLVMEPKKAGPESF